MKRFFGEQMADRDKQQWADALAALHAGQHDEEPQEHDEHDSDAEEAAESADQVHDPDEAQQASQDSGASPPPPAAPSPPPKRSRRPSSPIEAFGAAPPAAAPQPPSPSPPATARPARPQTPPPPAAHPQERDLAPEYDTSAPADFMPAAPATARPRPRPMPVPRSSAAIVQSIGYRRTLIPVLLTSAFILWVFAAWMLIRSGSAILGEISPIYPVVMVLAGFVLLILAVLNMLQVKRQLEPPHDWQNGTGQEPANPSAE